MRTLTRNDFLNAPAARRERVEVPALGGAVFVRQITVGERDEFEAASAKLKAAEKKGKARARLVVLVTVDEAGAPLFSAADVDALAARPSSEIEPIIDAHVRLNEMTRADVEDLEKN